MKTTSIFSVIKTFVFATIILAMQSCASETLITIDSVADGVKYTLDDETKEATAVGYIEEGGNRLTKINVRKELSDSSGNLKFTVTAVGDMAFAGATACERVEIGANVRTIGVKAFSGCTAIKVVKLNGTIAPTLPEDAFEAEIYSSATLIIPKGCDITSTTWSKFKDVVEI